MNFKLRLLRLIAPASRHKDHLWSLRDIFSTICNIAIPALLFIAIGLVIYDFGFKPFWRQSNLVDIWIRIILDLLSILMGVRLILDLFVA